MKLNFLFLFFKKMKKKEEKLGLQPTGRRPIGIRRAYPACEGDKALPRPPRLWYCLLAAQAPQLLPA